MIELLTFTGVDSETPLAGLSDLARRYPRVEFGVLVGSHIGGIFPPRSVVDEFKAYANAMGIRTALHLCGRYARTVADPRGVGATDLWELCAGFERIQVNLHGDWFDPERVHLTGHGIEYFADRVTAERVILQHRGEWDSVPVKHEKVEYLFNVSEGGASSRLQTGRSRARAFDAWDMPADWGQRTLVKPSPLPPNTPRSADENPFGEEQLGW